MKLNIWQRIAVGLGSFVIAANVLDEAPYDGDEIPVLAIVASVVLAVIALSSRKAQQKQDS